MRCTGTPPAVCRRLAVVGLVLAGLACGPKVQLVDRAGLLPEEGRAPGCEVELVASVDAAGGVRKAGLLFVGDSGWTTSPCKREDVLARLRQEACRAGASAAHVIRIQEPRPADASSCYQVWAELLVDDGR